VACSTLVPGAPGSRAEREIPARIDTLNAVLRRSKDRDAAGEVQPQHGAEDRPARFEAAVPGGASQ
jgi:hypothetical protein